jgi:hypothetical protein
LLLAVLLPLPAAQAQSAQTPPVPDYASLTDERAVQLCDEYAAHPLDPLKPSGVAGVSADANVAHDAAYIACNRALVADQTNPRILFQWGRVNYARTGNNTGQPRQMFRLAYKGGSEIAGVYLAQLPPEQSLAELEASVQRRMREMRGARRSRPMTGAQRDEMLIGSIVTIGSTALLRILSGEAAPSGECSGGYMIDINTHEMLCNGLVVGNY